MSSRPENASEVPASSLSLFDENAPSTGDRAALNDDLMVRNTITHAIKLSGKSREQIADEMSLSLGQRVTERMISAFTSESKELHRWPSAWDRAFCAATHNDSLLRSKAEMSGLRVITGPEISILELGRAYLTRKRAAEKMEELEAKLREVAL